MSGVVGPKKPAPPSVHSALAGMGVLSSEAPAVQHTPGPWRASKRNPKRIVSMGKYRETDRRSIPCTVASCESEDDAARIVQCVKAHDDMLAALQRSLDWLASYPGGGTLGKDGPYEQVRAAIAKAGSTSHG